MASEDFFSQYLAYMKDTEVPVFFHRWSAISGIGALLGRNFYINHGHFRVNTNMYCMLIGNPGTRKSSAIKLMKNILIKAGYNTIAADKTTKEKFLLDLAETNSPEITVDNLTEINLFGDSLVNCNEPTECFIMADEFNDFFGNHNIEFISLLGTLWDYTGVYTSRVKNSKSISISDPTISILGGNTPTGFSLAFPPEILGQGFFSRILLIYGEPSGKKIAFPVAPKKEETAKIIESLIKIRANSIGEVPISTGALKLLDHIYSSWLGVQDVRFESYSNRRFTHLLKLTLIHAAASYSSSIQEAHVIYANTILTYTEHFMPKALGEFGKAKHSDISHKIVQLLENNNKVFTLQEIWKHLHNDLERITDLAELLRNLVVADKITADKRGFLPKRSLVSTIDKNSVDYGFLTQEERLKLKEGE